MVSDPWVPGGATVSYLMIGHPTVQVRSPMTFNRWFRARDMNAVMIAADLRPDALPNFIEALRGWPSVGGLIVTVPHKQAAFTALDRLSDRAKRLGAVNVIRRQADGELHGDMVDGLGFANALARNGFEVRGKRAALIGAGGVGAAIALALLDKGVDRLDIFDLDPSRLKALRAMLDDPRVVCASSAPDIREADLVVNATPAGMNGDASVPIQADQLRARMFVADVVTKPEETPLLRLARQLGCPTQTGGQMADAQFEPLALAMGIAHADLTPNIAMQGHD